MRPLTPIIAIALTLTAAPVAAQSELDSLTLASNLGTILGSEEFCGLTYDHNAISNYIDEHAPAADMSFASTLQTMVNGQLFYNSEMQDSARIAHCRAVENTARHYGFIE